MGAAKAQALMAKNQYISPVGSSGEVVLDAGGLFWVCAGKPRFSRADVNFLNSHLGALLTRCLSAAFPPNPFPQSDFWSFQSPRDSIGGPMMILGACVLWLSAHSAFTFAHTGS